MARHDRRVPYARRINWYDPESAGLVACYVATPGGMMNLVNGGVGTRAGTADTSPSNDTGTLDSFFDGVGDQYGFGTDVVIADVTAALTIVWEANLASFVDAFPLIGGFARGVASQPLTLFYSNNASYNDIALGYNGQAGADTIAYTLGNGISVAGERHWGVWTKDAGAANDSTITHVYINGEEQATTTGSSLGATTDTTTIGGNTQTNQDWNGVIRQVRVYNRAWSQAEAKRFYDPATRDLLFAPPRRKIFFGVSAAAAFKPAWASQRSRVINGVMH